jgi:uncharacterized membrane protein
MNPLNITFIGQNFSQMTAWAFCSLIVALILWIWSVVVVAKEKTEDPYDRIVWLLIVLILNFLGTLLYFFFGGDAKKEESQKRKSEEDIKRRANDGTL